MKEFRVKGRVCQSYPETGRHWRRLAEPGGQARFDMLNRHPSQPFVLGLTLTAKGVSS